jgi:polyhydroxyalkanoate synthase
MSGALAPTPRDVVLRDGSARLYRFRSDAAPERSPPVLLVPSLINRWYVLDLRPEVSLAAALVGAGFDTFCLDWGIARDEDRFLSWDDLIARLGRMVRRVRRLTGHERVALLGYCMGATLCAIHAALEPLQLAALVNLLGPIDFRSGGLLSALVDRRWFDADAIADAGNVHPVQMQCGFLSLRPTSSVAKWMGLVDRIGVPGALEAFNALETWASDNVPFPAEAYRTYIKNLYQDNQLVLGQHSVLGRRVDLKRVACPVLTVAAQNDTICPAPAARALNDHVGSSDCTFHVCPGGHVGAVVGNRAPRDLYPLMTEWLTSRLCG